jgi:hypothetical protein
MNTCKKSRRVLQLMQSWALALSMFWMAGCSTAGYHKGDTAARSSQEAAARVQAESRAIDETVSALNDLANKPSGDLKLQFKRFSHALEQMIAAAKRSEAMAARMEQKHTAYFQAWDKELPAINYEIIRTRSEARREEVARRFEAVDQSYHEADTVVQPLIDYFEDIRRALSADLTMGGLAAVKDIVHNADDNAAKVQTALSKLSNDLAAASNDMSSVALQNTK